MNAYTLMLVALLGCNGLMAQSSSNFDIDFAGGSAREFADSVGELGINVLVPGDAGQIQIPQVRLRNVTADSMFEVLNIIGDQAPIRFAWIGSGAQPMIVSADGSLVGSSNPRIWVLHNAGSQRVAQPFAIGHLIESDSNEAGYSVDEITSAIDSTVRAAAAAAGRESELSYQFHEGTELLIITGLAQDVRTAELTVSTLRQSQQAKRNYQRFGLYGETFPGLVSPDYIVEPDQR